MAYQAWSVVFGEQPSASKWNILGTNDAGFNDGTAIATGAITATHISGLNKSLLTTDSNPYKFSAYPSATVAISATAQKVALNTENFDTNSNFDSTTNYRYTAPVSGFYLFSGSVAVGSAGMGTTEWMQPNLYKNGAVIRVAERQNGSGDANRLPRHNLVALVQLSASDYIELYSTTGGVYRDIVGGSTPTWLEGFLVCRT